MPINSGKEFEAKFKKDFLKTMPHSSCNRLLDVSMGYKRVSNICDFEAYKFPWHYYIECKSTLGGTFNIKKLTQLDKLKEKIGIPGELAGVVIWFIEKHQVCFVPVAEFLRLQELGYKSINCKMIGDPDFRVIEVPSTLKRVFMDSDYKILETLSKEDFEDNLKKLGIIIQEELSSKIDGLVSLLNGGN